MQQQESLKLNKLLSEKIEKSLPKEIFYRYETNQVFLCNVEKKQFYFSKIQYEINLRIGPHIQRFERLETHTYLSFYFYQFKSDPKSIKLNSLNDHLTEFLSEKDLLALFPELKEFLIYINSSEFLDLLYTY